jgi:hypothetical protein
MLKGIATPALAAGFGNPAEHHGDSQGNYSYLIEPDSQIS